ncbi:MAG: hypothetical protein ABJ239_10730 [Erythrobacter sp.]
MTPYQRALRHAKLMMGVLASTIVFVIAWDQIFGHSFLAFAAAIVALVFANGGMLLHNCPHCGKNLFFRGIFVVPWPNKTCGRCKADLTAPPSP